MLTLTSENPPGFRFEIPTVYLGGPDRRVLSSTIESLLSKNETVVYTTASFFRDVLLQDYPPEVFIQESALCMAVVEVAESSWSDPKIHQVSKSGLLLLSSMLRIRFSQLNSTEFFETKRNDYGSGTVSDAGDFNLSRISSTSRSTISRYSAPTDTFISTLCQLLKGVSRALLFQPQDFHMWMILDSFALTLCKCSQTFPVDIKTLYLGVEEILLDLSYCYEKHSHDINSTLLAICLVSLLKSLQANSEPLILAYDVRQCLRKLSGCPLMLRNWPEIHKYFLKVASSMVDGLTPTAALGEMPKETEDFSPSRNKESQPLPKDSVTQLLIAVQNATGHPAVFQAIDNLWGYVVTLSVNVRSGNSVIDEIFMEAPWRDSFYRFLCVEPTCIEDIDLLVKVLDLITFVIANLGCGYSAFEEWVIPLCMEKDCALHRVLSAHCLVAEPSFSGTVLPNVLRSLFDFFCVIMKRASDNSSVAEYKWNVFNNFCLIFHKIGDFGFSYTAVCQPLLRGIATFLTMSEIKGQIIQNPNYNISLIFRINEFIISLQERSGDISPDSFRNQGSLYYASLSLYNCVLVLVDLKQCMSSDWMGTCCAVIPCFWESRAAFIRATAFQISEVLSRSVLGAVALMTVLDSPSTIWTTCYHSLVEPEEPAIVKQYAANTIYNLLVLWDDIERATEVGQSLQLPSWLIMEDFTKLLSHTYWQPTLSETFRSKVYPENTAEVIMSGDEGSTNPQLVSPKTVTVLCKIIIRMKSVNLHPFHPEPYPVQVCSSGLCAILFRLVGLHSVNSALKKNWWIDCCTALSSVVETLISLCQLDREVCKIIIGDKRSMVSLIHLLTLELPASGKPCQVTEEILSTLWVNVFSLLALVCNGSGTNFEDFERCISSQRNIVFGRVEDWMKQQSLAKCRKVALVFCNQFICRLTSMPEESDCATSGHPVFCREWKDGKTYGSVLSECLYAVYYNSNDTEERQLSLRTLTALCNISPSAKTHVTDQNLIGVLIMKIREFGQVYHSAAETLQFGKKSNIFWVDETISILYLLSSLMYKNVNAKKSAFSHDFPNTLHKIFKWWIIHIDRSFLHVYLEALLNFTEEFPPGCQALTLTSSVIGVGPKKAPSAQSLLFEILELLQHDLNAVDSCTPPSVELMFEFLKNASFVPECRNILPKSSILQFFSHFRVREMKKWSQKRHRIKMAYLGFLLQTSIFPDMQIAITKTPEATENLVAMIDYGDIDAATLSLKLLRNLCFQSSNRTRFLCDDTVMQCLSNKIKDSDNAIEVECAAVALWAILSNSEKGKLLAKKCNCPSNVAKALVKLKKLEQSSNDLQTEKQDVSTAIKTLNMLVTLLGPVSHQSLESLIS